jgi:hypothetical protein
MSVHKNGDKCPKDSIYRCNKCDVEKFVKSTEYFPMCNCTESEWVSIIEDHKETKTDNTLKEEMSNFEDEIIISKSEAAVEVGKNLIQTITITSGIVFIIICLYNLKGITNDYLNDIGKCIFNMFTTIVGFVLGFFYQSKDKSSSTD